MKIKTDCKIYENNNIYDVIVVGAGPCGSMAAKYSLKFGAKKVLVIEEHPSIGSPVQCTGIISTSAYNEAELNDNFCILEEFQGAFVHSSSGDLTLEGNDIMAYSISRRHFDLKIAESASKAGAEFRLKTKCVGIEKENEIIKLNVMESGVYKSLSAKIVIAADGFKSKVSKLYGLDVNRKLLPSCQFEVSGLKNKKGYVDIYIGSVAPGFFGWCVPISSTQSRVGLSFDPDSVVYERPKKACDLLNELVLKIEEKQSLKTSQMSVNFGAIPLGYLKKTYADNFMVVGDAAGHCKPFSGGGIKLGLQASKIAGEIAAKSIIGNNFSEEFLKEYEIRWKSIFGKEIDIGIALQKIRNSLNDDDLNSLIKVLNDAEISEMITKYGDIDKPSIFFKKLFLSKHAFKILKTVPVRRLISIINS